MKILPLTQGKVAIVDDTDFEKVRNYKWSAATRKHLCYAQSRINGKCVLLHAFLLKPALGMEIDHRDGNGLNNLRSNLRICTHAQNQQAHHRSNFLGTSKFRGVSFETWSNRWRTQVSKGGKRLYSKRFDSEEEAARAYDKKARELFGEYASPNFQ